MAQVHAELTATCNSLGYAGSEKYCIDPQCTEAIRDLIKFLRRDGDDHEIRRFLGEANIVETDLLPILVGYSDKLELFDLVIRLLVNLTTPALLIFNEQPPVEKQASQYYLQMVLHLQKYKRAFTDVDVWKVIADKLAEVIQAEYHEKGQEKVLSTVRLLILARNVLHVPADNDYECRPDNDANLHDKILWAMHQSQLIDIIMYIACSDNEQQFYLHALEIISLMLRDQNAAELANASVNRSETEKQRDEHELKAVLEKEQKEKLDKLKKYSASRHSKFGGRFVVSGMKSIGENEMVVSSMTSNINKAFDRYKKPLKTPRNRMPIKNSGVERKSAFSVRLFLKEFCVEFLQGAYNTLMKHVREMLVRSKGQPNDESYYFWAMHFFMEFNRNHKFEIKLVSETMALNIFHFVQERIEESREKLLTDKKKIPVWSKRMHLGLKAYKELMETLHVMYQSKDSTLQSSARTILTNLFYMAEYRDFLLSLISFYDELKFSRVYLKDLIESNHVFMKLLEHTGKKQRNLIVLCKPKKMSTSKKSKPARQEVEQSVDDATMWTDLNPDLVGIIQKSELVVDANESRPYDPISETSMDDQKAEAMCRIRMYMRTKRLEDSVKLLRASREVWPEDGYFGKPRLSSDEELEILKEIFYADLGLPSGHNENEIESNNQNENDNDRENQDDEDDEDEESSQIRMEEANFEFIDFVKKFAKPKVLQSCCQLLKDFDKNSTYTNHVVVKLLHRITYDCKYSALMFQASVFRVFQKIFVSKNPNHKELKHFAIYVMRKFTEVARKNNKVFIELLFWKDLKTAFEIEEGYDTDHTKTTNWNEEQEDELHRLHEEYLQNMPEEDEVTWICRNLIRQDRSRISVVKKLKQLGINPVKKNKKPNREFSEAEIVQITQLVQEFRESSNPIGFILEGLDVKRPKKHIIDKIVELGLVGDRKELRKKRSKDARQSNQNHSSSDESNESDDGDDDDRVDTVYHSLTSVYVLNAVKTVLDKDMKPALLWLVESLDETAEDLDVDESDVPLLPLTDECMAAVNDDDFQNAMELLGIHRPSGIQETYWRIPGKWQANDIRQRSATITSIIEGTFVADNCTNTASRVEESSDEDVGATFDKIRKSLVQNRVNDSENTNTSTVPDESDNKENMEMNKKAVQKKRKLLSDDSNTEEEVISVRKKINNSTKEENIKKNIISSDDNDEDTAGRVEDSSDEDVGATFDKIRKSLVRNSLSVSEKVNTSTVPDESDNKEENVGLNKKAVQNKRKFLSDNSDSEDEVISVRKKVNNSAREENVKKSSFLMKRNVMSSDDSDDEVAPVKNVALVDSDNEHSDVEKKCLVKVSRKFESSDEEDEFNPITKQVSSIDSDSKTSKVPKKMKRILIEDSSDDDVAITPTEKNSIVNTTQDNTIVLAEKTNVDGSETDDIDSTKNASSSNSNSNGSNTDGKERETLKKVISNGNNKDGRRSNKSTVSSENKIREKDDESVSSKTGAMSGGDANRNSKTDTCTVVAESVRRSTSSQEDNVSRIRDELLLGRSGDEMVDKLTENKICVQNSESLFDNGGTADDCDTIIILNRDN